MVSVLTELPDRDVRRISASEFWQLAEVLDLDRVDLVDGVLIQMSPEHSKHVRAVVEVFDLLRARYPDRQVLPGGSIELSPDRVLTPDVVVLDAPPDQTFDPCPSANDVLLLVEVAVSSWQRDIGWKLTRYAEAGIPDYWVIRPTGPTWELHRFTEPDGSRYNHRVVVPLATPGRMPPNP